MPETMNREQQAAEALTRASTGQSLANYGPIFEGFIAKGIAEADIRPRENVFTFNAWRALGRTVKRGEHGVKVTTWVPMTKKDDTTGTIASIGRRAKSATVFHLSQTKPLDEPAAGRAEDHACSDSAYEDECTARCGL